MSQMGLAGPTEQDIGLHWKGARSQVETGGLGRHRGCCQGELFPTRPVDKQAMGLAL